MRLLSLGLGLVLFSSIGFLSSCSKKREVKSRPAVLMPKISVAGPSPAFINNLGSTNFVVNYTGATTISLSEENVSLVYTGTARDCELAVTGSGAKQRAVTLSSCAGDGTVSISIQAGTAESADLKPALDAGPSQPVTVDNIAPTLSFEGPTSTPINSLQSTSYVVNYTGATNISLSEENVSLVYTGTARDCELAVTGSGAIQRTVTLSSCTGTGTVSIQILEDTAVDEAKNSALAAQPSNTLTIDNSSPAIRIEPASVTLINKSGSTDFLVDYANVTEISLNTENVDLNYTGSAKDCVLEVSGSGLSQRTVTLSSCTGDGTVSIRILEGTAKNAHGVPAPAAQSNDTVTIDNDPPRITIGAPSKTSINESQSTDFVITYNGAANISLSDDDIEPSFSEAGAQCKTQVSVSGEIQRTVTLSSCTGTGTVSIQISEGTAVDEASNSAGASDPSQSVAVINPRFTSLTLGKSHTCGISTKDKKAYCWGSNDYGQLGIPEDGDKPTPQPVKIDSLNGASFVSITAGGYHTCALASNNKVYCWGRDHVGQIGDGEPSENKNQPTEVDTSVLAGAIFTNLSAGFSHTCGITDHDNTFCWGEGADGRLGNGDQDDQESPKKVEMNPSDEAESFKSITAGDSHTCGITGTNKTYCWGKGTYGRLGNGDTKDQKNPVEVEITNLGPENYFASITAGGAHTCGISSDGKAFCWGYDNYGELGDSGTNTNQKTPTEVYTTVLPSDIMFKNISLGTDHTCALASNNKVYCWGQDNVGQIGDDEAQNHQNSPTEVSMNPLNGASFLSIATGGDHACGLVSDGEVFCWGRNNDGELGNDGRGTHSFVPSKVAPLPP